MANVTQETVSMVLPTTRKDGSALGGPDLQHIRLYRQGPTDSVMRLLATIDTPVFPVTTYVDSTIQPATAYNYAFSCVDENGNEGDQSNQYPVVVPANEAAPAAGTISKVLPS